MKKRRLAWLKNKLDCLFDQLSEEEYLLLSIRYFGRISLAKSEARGNVGAKGDVKMPDGAKELFEAFHWSERSYYRKQERVLKKITAKIQGIGITKEVFEREFLEFEFLRAVYRFLNSKRKKFDSPKERAIVRMMNF